MLETDYKFGEVFSLSPQIMPSEERVQFKRVFDNPNGGVSLLAFRAGQKLDEHLAPANVMVCVIEGEIRFTMIDKPLIIKSGEFMLMGKDVLHKVEAIADSKVMLIKVKP